MTATGWAVVVVALLLACLVVVLLARVRFLASRVGAFECALRQQGQKRWMSGVAVFGDDAVEWYRLVSLWPGAKYRLRRDGIVLGQAHHRGGSARVVELECQVGPHVFQLGMREDSHSAFVAWLEAAAPTQPTLF